MEDYEEYYEEDPTVPKGFESWDDFNDYCDEMEERE